MGEIMERRKINRTRFFLAFIFTTAIFLIGMWFGQNMLKSKFSEIEEMQNDFRKDTVTIENEYMFLAQNPCFLLNSSKFASELYLMGERLEFMEESHGKDNKDVLRLKEYYSLLEMRHWLFLEEIKKKCNYDIKTILYFYSNRECNRCVEQGYILTFLRNSYPELNVYSFDVDIDNSALDILRKSYGVTSKNLPFIVFGNKTFSGFISAKELQNEL